MESLGPFVPSQWRTYGGERHVLAKVGRILGNAGGASQNTGTHRCRLGHRTDRPGLARADVRPEFGGCLAFGQIRGGALVGCFYCVCGWRPVGESVDVVPGAGFRRVASRPRLVRRSDDRGVARPSANSDGTLISWRVIESYINYARWAPAACANGSTGNSRPWLG